MDVELRRLLDDPSADFALMHLDLDFFKQVNDTMAMPPATMSCRRCRRSCAATCARMDMAARVGGDEFLIILRDTVAETAIAALADRLIRKIERPIPFEGRICRVSASVGFAVTTGYALRPDADGLLADTDAALYRAKNAGRGTLAIHGQPDVRDGRADRSLCP
jgi:diguanylate cyclase (GGDEF)-like protein